jgi:hypothetical protein
MNTTKKVVEHKITILKETQNHNDQEHKDHDD